MLSDTNEDMLGNDRIFPIATEHLDRNKTFHQFLLFPMVMERGVVPEHKTK